ncbi:MAG: hypothetical protein H6626_11075 [Pseudobdellovibrionaceae bacterium]|nr:hypothetical protein [Bdellovibrionales bacterium]USN46744.1 MAG: hypothetical protein H6626_11075 [Pseudobdellovibrionaceae bacterium]
MASPTKKTRLVREKKEHKRGRVRKAENNNKGTTKSWSALFGESEK